MLPAQNSLRRVACARIAATCALALSLGAPAAFANADGTWENLATPGALIDQVAVYDPAGDRMVVFGGISETQSGGSNLTWSWSRTGSPAWTPLDAIDTNDPITGLYDATALLDPVRHRMLVFGGTDGALRNDVWSLSLDGNAKWVRLQPTGTLPTPREGSALVYDSARDRMILLGGNAGGWNSEVWAFSLDSAPAWTQLTALGTPPPGVRPAAVYDAADDRMVVYNGTTLWQLSFAADANQPAWLQLTATGPPPTRANFTAVFDSSTRRMIVYGGNNGSGGTFGEAWALSLSPTLAWSQLVPAGSPARARFVHSAAFDGSRHEMIVFGGLNYENLVQTWLASTATLAVDAVPEWHVYGGDLSAPRANGADAGVYDSRRDRFFVGGIFSANPALGWSSQRVLDLSTASGWSNSPGFVDDRGTAIYDPRFDGVVSFGGQDSHLNVTHGGPLANSLGAPSSWTGSSGPSPGTSATRKAIYDPVRYRIVMFGGDNFDAGHGIWAVGLASPHLAEAIVPLGTPPPDRIPDVVIYDPARDRMIVFGGWEPGTNTYFNDAWAVNLAGTPEWTPLAPSGAPPAGAHYFGIYDPVRDRLVAYSAAGVWSLPLASASAWVPLAPTGVPPDPLGTEIVTVYDPLRDRMLVQYTPAAMAANSTKYTTTAVLSWAEPARPSIACAPDDSAHIVSLTLNTTFEVANALAGPRAIGWKLESDRAWPGLPRYGTAIVAGATSQPIVVHAPVPDSAATGNSVLRFTAWYEGGEGFNAACTQTLAIDATTAALPAFESMAAAPDLVTLRWDLAQDASLGATIYRRDDAAVQWQSLGPATIESGRFAVYRDTAVEPGATYWYRAGIPRAGGELLLAPVRVSVPASLALAIEAPRPNPARALRVAFTLPDRRAATLDVFDIGGRRIAHEDLAGRPAGRQEFEWRGAPLASGIYLVRLRQGDRMVATRAAIVR